MGSHEVKAQHSKDDMIPRITIRDAGDALILKNAVLAFARNVQTGFARQSAVPGADQFALTLQMNKELDMLMTLISDIDAGTIGDAGTTTQED